MSDKMSLMDDKIILRSSFGKVGQKYFLQPAINPETGRMPDHVKVVNAMGDMVLTEREKDSGEIFIPVTELFEIEDGHVFNLDNPWDKAVWKAIEHNRIIAPNRLAKNAQGEYIIDGRPDRYSSIAELYISQPGFETRSKVAKKVKIHNAQTFIISDSIENRRKIFKLVGRDPRNVLDIDIQDYLMQTAEKDPDKIIDLYTGEDLHLRLLFVDAMQKGVIIVKNRIYTYADNVALGATDEAVINYLRDSNHKSVLTLIRKDVYGDEMQVTNPDALAVNSAQDEENSKSAKKSK